jgi:hypothetical protein
MKLISLLCVAVAVAGVSCERHEFEGPNGTRKLHEHTGGHGEPAAHEEKPAH